MQVKELGEALTRERSGNNSAAMELEVRISC
jgi:hypothetical protein